MTQHPFDREFSEQEAAKLNLEQEQTEAEEELTDEDVDQVAGGISITRPITKAIGEEGGTATKAAWWVETGSYPPRR